MPRRRAVLHCAVYRYARHSCDAPSRTVKGLGVRYFAAEKLGIHVGVDVARGPEETYWYLTMGSAWR